MSHSSQTSNRSQSRLRRNALAAALTWTAFIAATVGWNMFEHWQETLDNARHDAQVSFQKEILVRLWEEGHGDTAPATNNVPPSSYLLRAEERNLVNPLAMMHRVHRPEQDRLGLRSHLAGLKPLGSGHTPDAWETRALKAFEKGEAEVSSVEMMDGQKYMRVMRPLVNEADCARCHSAENHKVGDVQGGISVAVPLAPLWAEARHQLMSLVIGHGAIWLLGLGVIGFGARRMQAHNLERAKATDVLRESEEHLKEAQRLARVGSWQWTVATDTVKWSEVLYEINGRDPKLPAPRFAEMASCYTPESWNRLSAAVAKALHTGESCELELEMVRPDGTTRQTLVYGEADYDAGGKIVSLHGAVQDITARKRAQEAIEQSYSLLAATLESTADGILVVDAAGKVASSNRRFVEMWRIPETLMATRDDGRLLQFVLDQLQNPDAFLDKVRALYQAPDASSMDELAFKDGRVFERYSQPRRMGGSIVGRVWSFRDITERKKAGEALRQSRAAALNMMEDAVVARDGAVKAGEALRQEVEERRRAEDEVRRLNAELEQRVTERTAELQAANKEMEAFSYSVSHDLRAPLRAMSGFAGILTEDYAARLDEEGRRLLGTICSEAGRMGQMIDELLAFSRLGRQSMQVAEVDMTALAQSVFDQCAAQASGRNIQFKLSPLPAAQGDAAMLSHVWANLISNAIKYTRAKPVAEIEISGRADGKDGIVYCVKDNGAGFDMKYVQKLFGVFQRLHAEADFEGTGVGLALVQRIVQRHGGRVWAESTLNESAAFYFALPAEKRRDG